MFIILLFSKNVCASVDIIYILFKFYINLKLNSHKKNKPFSVVFPFLCHTAFIKTSLFIAYRKKKLSYKYFLIRGAAIGGARRAMAPHFNFPTKQGPTISVSNTRDVAFYEYSEIIWTRNFTIFNMYVTIFGQFTAAFHFFLTT